LFIATLYMERYTSNGVSADVLKLLINLETHSSHHGIPEALYENLIPTLGERALDYLYQRFNLLSSDEKTNRFIPDLITKAIIVIGKTYPEKVKVVGKNFLNKNNNDLCKEAGLSILKEFPDLASINKIWEIHKFNTKTLGQQESKKGSFNYILSFEALKSCVQLQSKWVEESIENSDPKKEPTYELGWLLLNLQNHKEALIIFQLFFPTNWGVIPYWRIEL